MIIPMKKAEIVVLKEDRQALLKSLQRYGEFMVISDGENKQPNDEKTLLQKAERSLSLLKKYREKPPFVRQVREVDYEDFVSESPRSIELLARIEDVDQELKALEQKVPLLNQLISSLMVWKELEFVPSESKDLKTVSMYFGFTERRYQDALLEAATDLGFIIKFYGSLPDYSQATLVAVFKDDEKQVLDQVKALGFSETMINTQGLLTSDQLDALSRELEQTFISMELLKEELRTLAREAKDIELLSDKMESVLLLHGVNDTVTMQTCYLEGWVRSDRIERFEKSVQEATSLYDIALSDPTEEDNPPTVVENNKFVRPFETVTDMFSMPSKGDIDPNPVMSFWYWITFGLMMGDAGYGLVMMILFYVLIKAKKPKGDALKLFKMLFLSGITTIFWGVLFGSYFGATWNPILFVPMDEPLKMLIFSLVFGAVQIICAIVCAAYKNYRNGKFWDILFDQISWIMMILGLGFLVIPALATIGMGMALVGALLVVTMAGRSKKNIFGRLGSGFGSLYGITGYLSDILSYSRLLALGLSTAVVSMVMNTMAAMIQGNAIGFILSLFVYAIGHSFNIAMGLLSAYVHDSRLQYIEFFGKFYEGGGYAFKPLSYKLNYVDKVNDQ